ncbi:uncharacterized protein [Littorina saxatilis]|uniref:uncharacterized protein isoform X6 n=1 Tax=Littorina saxatilis TaxID=31220 RepID=UPI0038B4C6A2
MEKMGEEAAAKFINALIKSVQTLCHGYLDFQTGIEIIGHINLSVDKENSLDYILKEKVCKNAENSTLFISHSFHAEPKSEQEVPVKNAQAGNQNVQSRQPTDSGESGRVSSALSSISSALSGSRERSRQSNTKDSGSPHSYQSTAKRKASDDSGSEVRPSKVSSHHDSISHTSSDSAFPPTSSSPVDSKQSLRHLRTSDDNMSQTMLPQTANFTSDNAADIGVNLAGSVLEPVDDQSNPDLPERDDESDGDLEVTFIKEEYMEGERSACEFENSGQQFVGGPHRRASEGMPDPSLYPVALHGSSASATYVPSAHDQQFQPGSLGPSTSQPQPGPSGMRGNVCQQQAAQPLPPGARPGCGYVHPADAQKWMVGSYLPHWSLEVNNSAAVDVRTSLVQPQASAANTTQIKKQTCDQCGTHFKNDSNLKAHVRNVHMEDGGWRHKCHVCRKTFRNKETCLGHVQKHTGGKSWICKDCGQQYLCLSSLQRHEAYCGNRDMATCEKEKAYACNFCNEVFKRKSSLYDHKIAKHSNKSLMCAKCGKGFTWRNSLRRHVESCQK